MTHVYPFAIRNGLEFRARIPGGNVNGICPAKEGLDSAMSQSKKLKEKATQALDKKNYDYAANLFRQLADIDPGDPDALQGLRTCAIQSAKVAGDPPARYVVQAKNLINEAKILFFTSTKKWDKLLGTTIDAICVDPGNVRLFKTCGRAAFNTGKKELGIYCYGLVLDKDSENFEALYSLGKLYEGTGELETAQDYIRRAVKADPTSHDAAQAEKAIAAKISIEQSKGKSGVRDFIRDEDEAQALEKKSHFARTDDEIQDLIEIEKKALEESPNDNKALRRIGDLYAKKKDFEEAEQAFSKLLEMDPEDFQVKGRLGDLRIAKSEHAVETQEKAVEGDQTNVELRKKLEQMKKDHLLIEIEVFSEKVKDRPTDLSLRFELGERFFKAGKIDEAIAEFQHSVKDPKRKLQSQNYLGKAFKEKKMYDMAANQFLAALEFLPLMNPLKKDILYTLADTYELKGLNDSAKERFTELLSHDIGYKDVSKRVSDLE